MSSADHELERLLRSGSDHSAGFGPDHHDLWSGFSRAAIGGKRFRPDLVVSTHDALNGSSPGPAARVGAAVETLHTAFVVHDDVIDGDDVRRGVPNISGTFAAAARTRGGSDKTARTYADAAGILAGDLGLLSAALMVARCGAAPRSVDALLELLESTVHATATGELADVRLGLGLAGGPVTVEDALRVAELKTAVYSFQLPLQAGAILAEAPAAVTSALDRIGRLIGIGFQLLDDLLGVFGDESRTGKSALTDLREGKPTALLAHARTTPSWRHLRPLVGDPHLDDEAAGNARSLLTECGAREAIQGLADRHLHDALSATCRPPIPAALARILVDLVGTIRDTAARALVSESPGADSSRAESPRAKPPNAEPPRTEPPSAPASRAPVLEGRA